MWTFQFTIVKWHYVAGPYTLALSINQTYHQIMTLLPNMNSYRITRSKQFNRAFTTDVACNTGMFTPPDTLSCDIRDLHIFYLLWPIFFVICPDFALRTSAIIYLYFYSVKLKKQLPSPMQIYVFHSYLIVVLVLILRHILFLIKKIVS